MERPQSRVGALRILGVATGLGVFSALQAYNYVNLLTNREQPFHILLALNLNYWYAWAVLVPLILWLARRVRFGRHTWRRAAAVHGAGVVVITAAHAVLTVTGQVVLLDALAAGRNAEWWPLFRELFFLNFDWEMMTYWAVVGLSHALDFHRESQERELAAAHLETKLAEAQLQALQRQLHPHFLFNTLNTISALMHRDTEAADAMLERLSDLLRLTLDRISVQQVRLKDELDFIDKYLEIERTRFGDRLHVHFEVDPDVLDARVPTLLLQPLVENAVRHGVAPKAGGGRVEVSGRREGDRLRLIVSDNGFGLPADTLQAFNQGVGLSNTRSRLEHLYGAAARIRVRPAAGRRAGGDGRHSIRDGSRAVAGIDGERGVNKIRTLVVDDEPMARERVLSLLQHEEDVEVVGECSDGPQALAAIQHEAPDLVFLDVQMPGLSGFDVIEAVGADKMPTVIFVTAYDEYAVRAFEVHALDYLLKPFGRERFRETLKHARASLERRRAGDLGRRLLALVNDIKPEPAKLDRLVVKSGGRVFFLRTEELDWIEAAGNYVRLHLGGESHLFRETMTRMEARLDPRRFARIHRSRIVNTERIKELQPWFNGEYVVILRDGTRLPLSRGYREKLQQHLGRGF